MASEAEQKPTLTTLKKSMDHFFYPFQQEHAYFYQLDILSVFLMAPEDYYTVTVKKINICQAS